MASGGAGSSSGPGQVDPTGIYCQEHPTAPLIEDYRAGDQICSQCGLVVGDRQAKNKSNNQLCIEYLI